MSRGKNDFPVLLGGSKSAVLQVLKPTVHSRHGLLKIRIGGTL